MSSGSSKSGLSDTDVSSSADPSAQSSSSGGGSSRSSSDDASSVSSVSDHNGTAFYKSAHW